jgi:hypothetical protein
VRHTGRQATDRGQLLTVDHLLLCLTKLGRGRLELVQARNQRGAVALELLAHRVERGREPHDLDRALLRHARVLADQRRAIAHRERD